MRYSLSKKHFTMVIIALVVIIATTLIVMNIENEVVYGKKLTSSQVETLISQSDTDNPFHIAATPEVVTKLNEIRADRQERKLMRTMLKRMQTYKPTIQSELDEYDMPQDLLVIPMIESKYQDDVTSQGPGTPVGLWQMTDETAKNFGLNINGKTDERTDVELSSEAALKYFRTLNDIFNDWGLTLLAYNAGEQTILDLVKKTNSKDVWVIARSPSAPSQSLNYLTLFSVYVIIMRNPELVGGE